MGTQKEPQVSDWNSILSTLLLDPITECLCLTFQTPLISQVVAVKHHWLSVYSLLKATDEWFNDF